MRSNYEFSPRLLVAVCWSVLAVLFSIPAVAHPVYLTEENYTWHYDLQGTFDSLGSAVQNPWDDEVQPQLSLNWGGGEGASAGSSAAASYESQQQSSDDAFSFSARSSVSAEGYMSFDSTNGYGFYSANIRQNFYHIEFLVTEEVLFVGNLALTNAIFPDTPYCGGSTSDCLEFGEFGDIFLSGSVLGPGTYSYWSGSPSTVGVGNAFDGFASVRGGPGTASYSSFTQFIDMQFTAVAVPTPSALALSLGAFGMMLFARSRRFRNRKGDMQLISES